MTDYLAYLRETHPRHGGVLFEQVHQASQFSTFVLRAMGLRLPGAEDVPLQDETYSYLCNLVNEALEGYFDTERVAPAKQAANEIWGEASDEVFKVRVTGLSETRGDGFTVSVDLNTLYRS